MLLYQNNVHSIDALPHSGGLLTGTASYIIDIGCCLGVKWNH